MIHSVEQIRDLFARFPVPEHPRPLARGEALFACVLVLMSVSAWSATVVFFADSWSHFPWWAVPLMLVVLMALTVINGKNEAEDTHFSDHSDVCQVATVVILGPLVGVAVVLFVALVDVVVRGRSMRWTEHANNVALTVFATTQVAISWALVVDLFQLPKAVAIIAAWTIALITNWIAVAVYVHIVEGSARQWIASLRSEIFETIDYAILITIFVFAISTYPVLSVGLVTTAVVKRMVERTRHELQVTKRELARDALTGLYTRRVLTEHLESMIDAGTGAIVIGDIDNFKHLNDTLGHVEGDRALVAAARSLDSVDDRFFVARFGGEEMVMAMPVTRIDEAAEAATLMLNAIRQGLGPWNTSMSIGVAVFDGETSVKEWIDRADQALYHSKRNGKDQVSVSLGRNAQIVAADVAVDFARFHDGDMGPSVGGSQQAA
jgi:diguanylate cyclase (GGDEF)-like protein